MRTKLKQIDGSGRFKTVRRDGFFSPRQPHPSSEQRYACKGEGVSFLRRGTHGVCLTLMAHELDDIFEVVPFFWTGC
jgi:hypothetical protein